jgi:hypothetical protein
VVGKSPRQGLVDSSAGEREAPGDRAVEVEVRRAVADPEPLDVGSVYGMTA